MEIQYRIKAHAILGNNIQLLFEIPQSKDIITRSNFSIVIATHMARKESVQIQLNQLVTGQISHLQQIFILWVDSQFDCPNLSFFDIKNIHPGLTIEIIPSTTGFITDRFLIPKHLNTETVLIMDDDLDVKPEYIEYSYVLYKKFGFENRIFGATRRICTENAYKMVQKAHYNMILTNFAFVSVDMLRVFNLKKYESLRNLTVSIRNCDDILFNFIIQAELDTFPLGIDIRFHDTSNSKGISTQSDHMSKRVYCCKHFQQFFGVSPLHMNHFYIVLDHSLPNPPLPMR